jgi:hypothetical protein
MLFIKSNPFKAGSVILAFTNILLVLRTRHFP